jgi:cation diffusion facilitator family transporter
MDRTPISNSTISILGALAGNLAVAAVKFAAWRASGSSAMLTEAIHSVVDSLNQVLLLFGERRGRRPPSRNHPFGHGLETYFWTFIVALLIFAIGGALGVYEGLSKLAHPRPATHVTLNVAVIAASAVMEGISLWISLRAARHIHSPVARRMIRKVGFMQILRFSKDPAIYEVLAENGAAILGLGFALIGVLASAAGIVMADALASIAIGLLLIAVAGFLMAETRSLLTGEAASPAVVAEIRKLLEADPRVGKICEIRSMHMGPEDILVGATLDFRDQLSGPQLEAAVDDITRRLQAAEPRITSLYLRPGEAVRNRAQGQPPRAS